MSRVLVTGGAGFIGSHLVDALVGRGDSVVVVDNLFSGREENLAGVRDRIEFVRGDIRDLGLVRTLVRGCDHVLHQAALASVPLSVDDPETTTAVNVQGTLNVLIAARDAGVKRVVFAASSAAYGETDVTPQAETLLPAPVSPYAASKVAGELYLRVFAEAYGLQTISLRYFNVFGPRQDPRSHYAAVIPKFITALLAGEAPVVFGTGRQSRDFIHVDNVVHANLLAMEAPGVPAGAVFNVGAGEAYDLLTLLSVIAEETGTRAEPVFAPPRAGDVMRTEASIDAIRAALGYRVVVDFREGLRRTIEWYRANGGRRVCRGGA